MTGGHDPRLAAHQVELVERAGEPPAMRCPGCGWSETMPADVYAAGIDNADLPIRTAVWARKTADAHWATVG